MTALGATLAALPMTAGAQAGLRCDLKMASTPGAGAAAACLDLVALQNGGQPVVTAGNATRISTDGFRLCPSAFAVSTPAQADIVFIYDNSGSMMAEFAVVDSATNDTNFYHNAACGNTGGVTRQNPIVIATAGTVTYQTATGPRTAHVPASPGSCQVTGMAGDPYNARAQVIRQAIDYVAQISPNSTAGVIAFDEAAKHALPSLALSQPGNAQRLKDSVIMDSVPRTMYAPPLALANQWLNDAALAPNQKKAIVFISDGNASEPNDNTFLNLVSAAIPIYGVFLGDSAAVTPTSDNDLRDIAQRSGGAFYLIKPGDTQEMNQVMQRIIQAITVVNLPASIEVTNTSLAPPMVSRSTSVVRNPDSSVSMVMDSILALKRGTNTFSVKVTMDASNARTYTLTVQADGPEAGATDPQLTCHPLPTLAMLNPQGGIDSVYPSGPAAYDVRLTRTASDLEQVVVAAVTRDSSRGAGWGDQETMVLPQATVTGQLATNLKQDQAFNGGSTQPGRNNNILEAAPDGEVVLTWTHPRDPRETATFRLRGRKIPVSAGFIDMVRVADVPKGVTIATPVTHPIVIRGGVTLGQTPQGATLAHKGDLFNPHKIGEAELNPNQTPTFVFKTAAPFDYHVTIFDHLGQYLCSQRGKVDSLRWEQMRGNADSLAVAFSILPVAESGQPFGTGVYIMKATLTTWEANRTDPGRPMRVTPATRMAVNRFGYRR